MNRLIAVGFALVGLAALAGIVVEALLLIHVWPTNIAVWKLMALIGLDAVFAVVLFFLAVVIWRAGRKPATDD